MKDEIITYREMCDNENIQTLQRGMNFRLNPNYSVILMSQRRNSPYNDKILENGYSIEYEGHDVPKTELTQNPKLIDQPESTKSGKLTQNGKFVKAVKDFKNGLREAELVKVYEKIFPGVWSEKGFFRLINNSYVPDKNNRKVFIYILEETEIEFNREGIQVIVVKPRIRIIPSIIKKQVWARDDGKCVICGADDELHFDHDLPYSKGGSSITADNVRILCARHNLQKSAKIE